MCSLKKNNQRFDEDKSSVIVLCVSDRTSLLRLSVTISHILLSNKVHCIISFLHTVLVVLECYIV